MVYGLIIFVVFLALAPLWHFMPTRRQRAQARMREAAALAGLFVEYRDLPMPQRYLERMPATDRQLLYYGCRVRPAKGRERHAGAWWRSNDGWTAGPVRDAPPAVAAQMPASVSALSVDNSSCGCYWQERGDVATVATIAQLLTRWAEELEGSV